MFMKSEPLQIGLTHLTIDTNDSQVVYDSGLTIPIFPEVFSPDWMPLAPCKELVISGGIAGDSCMVTILDSRKVLVVQIGIGNGAGANDVWYALNKNLPSALSDSPKSEIPLSSPWLAVRFHYGLLALGIDGARNLARIEQVLAFSFLRYKQNQHDFAISSGGNSFSWDGRCGKTTG